MQLVNGVRKGQSRPGQGTFVVGVGQRSAISIEICCEKDILFGMAVWSEILKWNKLNWGWGVDA